MTPGLVLLNTDHLFLLNSFSGTQTEKQKASHSSCLRLRRALGKYPRWPGEAQGGDRTLQGNIMD